MNRSKNRWVLFGVIVCLLVAISFCVIVASGMNARSVSIPDVVNEEPAEVTTDAADTDENPFHCAVMTFTEEEARSLLDRFEEERRIAEEEEARRKAEEAAREAASRRSFFAAMFKRTGVLRWGGWRWTWYSEKILPGVGLWIPGRYTDAYGFVRDGNGYLCLASDKLKKGTVVDTPLGEPGIVYDSGCGMYTLDIYVGW